MDFGKLHFPICTNSDIAFISIAVKKVWFEEKASTGMPVSLKPLTIKVLKELTFYTGG